MSSTMSQEAFQKFLADSLNADNQEQGLATSEADQRQAELEQYNEVNAQIDATIEQAKASAMEAGANLIGIGGIEGIRAIKGLYTSGKGLYTRIQQVKDIGQKIIAQKAAKTAKVEQLKEQKFNEAQAKNAEIDPLTGEAKGPVLDKEQFFNDADAAIAKADRTAIISKVRGAVAEKLNPIIDRVTAKATSTIDAVGSQVDSAVSGLTTRVNDAASYLKNGFGQYTDTANQLKQDYLNNYNDIKGLSDADLATTVGKAQTNLTKFADTQTKAGIDGIDEHVSTIKDLLDQGSRQSVAQARTLYKNLADNVKAVKPFKQLKDAQKGIDDTKTALEQGKADAVNQLNETRTDIVNKLDASRQRLETAKTIPENSDTFSGVAKQDVLDSIQKDIDNHNLDLQNAVSDTSRKISDLETSASGKIADLQSTITSKSSEILDAAGGATTDILTRVNRGISSAIKTTGEAISNVRSAIAPVTDVLGALVTPVAVWQGALSAENIVKGVDNGNAEAFANDAINVRFGVGAAKTGVQAVGGKIQSLISGKQQAATQGVSEAESEASNVGKTSADQAEKQTADFVAKEGASAGKSAGTAAGEDIATGLAETGGEDIAEVGLGDLALNAIPVVGEIADVGLAVFSVFEGIKSLFHHDSTPVPPPPPPPPPMVTSSVSFAGQAGVY